MSREYTVGVEVPSQSDLKTFSVCPRLWYEQNVTKEYVQPEEDYFLYGNLVDTLLTEPEKLDERFVKVVRKVEGTGIELVAQQKTLEGEIRALEEALAEKVNKTKEKGLAARRKKLDEVNEQVEAVRNLNGRIQITSAMWKNAHETAEVIRNNPFWQDIEAMKMTGGKSVGAIFQVCIHDKNWNFKGTLDCLYGTWKILDAIKGYCAGIVDVEEVRKVAAKCKDPILGIVDAKSTYALSKLDPRGYRHQLACYQEMIFDLTGIRARCLAVAGDKDSDRKMAQDFEYPQPLLDQALAEMNQVKYAFEQSVENMGKYPLEQLFPAAKVMDGKDQQCFRCSVCRERPYSVDGPYIVL